MKDIPNPGSKEAIALGCICPVMDNHHGEGVLIKGKRCFWYNDGCPTHPMKKIEKETQDETK